MSKREAKILIEDIIEAIDKILRYTESMNYDAFKSDSKTIDAVVRNMEIIGEAANHLPEGFYEIYPEVKWKQIIGLRHRIVHDYFGVDLELIWQIVSVEIPSLKAGISSLD